MRRKCPLCLKKLGNEDRLYRHCFRCGMLEQVSLGALPSGKTFPLLCSSVECRESASVDTGVYLLHVGCSRQNPFWDGKRVQIPLEVGYQDPDGRRFEIQHPLIERLRAVAQFEEGAVRPEMWFPFELFLATNEFVDDRRLGVLVMLSGSRSVGKSTISTVSLNPRTFVPRGGADGADGGGHLTIEDYAYVVPAPNWEASRTTKFLEYLCANCLIRARRTTNPWTQPTPAMEDNLRVAFLRGPTESHGAGEASGVLDWAGRWLGDLAGLRQTPGTRPRPASSAVLAFWDTPGEDNERALQQRLVQMSDQMDVVAFCLNAEQLSRFGCSKFRGGKGTPSMDEQRDSVAVVLDRMRTMARARVRCCVLVTKLDKVRAQLDAKKELPVIDRQEHEEGAWQVDARRLLADWLAAPTSRESERELGRLLRDTAAVPVFFVSVENLQHGDESPYGRGFVPFVHWCLDREVVR